MKRIFTILLAAVTVMSCGNNPQNSAIQKTESITMNLYYTGTDGNARKFVEEMESSGTADAIRAEEGNLRYDYFPLGCKLPRYSLGDIPRCFLQYRLK